MEGLTPSDGDESVKRRTCMRRFANLPAGMS
jgi:hypothetical protein